MSIQEKFFIGIIVFNIIYGFLECIYLFNIFKYKDIIIKEITDEKIKFIIHNIDVISSIMDIKYLFLLLSSLLFFIMMFCGSLFFISNILSFIFSSKQEKQEEIMMFKKYYGRFV